MTLQTHACHIVNTSPWSQGSPLSSFSVESGTWFHCKSAFSLSLSLLINILVIYQCKWNIIQEKTFQGCHTLIIQKELQKEKSFSLCWRYLLFFFFFCGLPPLSGTLAPIYKYYSEIDISEGQFSFITEEWKPDWILPFLSFFYLALDLEGTRAMQACTEDFSQMETTYWICSLASGSRLTGFFHCFSSTLAC